MVAKLAILAGMGPDEILALTWSGMSSTYANIVSGFTGALSSPKTQQVFRKGALLEGLLGEIENWKPLVVVTADNAFGVPVRAHNAAGRGEFLASVDWAEAGAGRARLGPFPGDASNPCNPDEPFGGGWKAGLRISSGTVSM